MRAAVLIASCGAALPLSPATAFGGSPAPSDGGAAGCRDVFYDRSSCGGECIPSTQYLTCHVADGGRCVP